MEEGADVVGGGVGDSAPVEPWIERFEAVHMNWQDSGGVGFGEPCAGGSDGVTEVVDEDLTVARTTRSPRWNVMERLAGST